MSKSLDYTMQYQKDYDDTTTERMASPYFDWVLKGKRELVRDTPYGVLKSVVEFNPNNDFNYLNAWSGEIDCHFSEELLEEQLIYIAREQLLDPLRVPCDEDGGSLGGTIENGDTMHIIFGNYVINIKETSDDSCFISVSLPMYYERIKRKHHGEIDTSTT